MSGVLVVGAAASSGPAAEAFYRGLLGAADTVIAADAAGEWCVRLGRVPDAVVGDFDSARPGAADRLAALGTTVELHDPAKDRTDLELAVAYAARHAEGPPTITAAYTGRMDHTLANIGVLLDAPPGSRIEEPSWCAVAASPGVEASLDLAPGTTFGVLSMGGATGVVVRGGRWTIDGEDLPPLSGRGVGNVASGGPVTAACGSGALILVAMRG